MDEGAIDILHEAERVRPAHDLIAAKLAEAAEPIIESDRREEWLAKRREGIGASEAAAVLGVDPWRGPLDVYLAKSNPGLDQESTARMRRGRALQPFLLAEIGAVTGLRPVECEVLYRSRKHGHMLATPDGVAIDEAQEMLAVEVKDVGQRMTRHWLEGPPIYVEAQVAHQLIVLGLERAIIGAWLDGERRPVVWHEYRLTAEVREYVVEAEAEFWRRVTLGDVPDFDPSELTSRTVEALYPADNGKTVKLPEAALALDAMREEATRELQAATHKKESAEAQLKALIGEASVGVLPGVAYSWKVIHRAGYTVGPGEYRKLHRKMLK